MPSKSRSPFWNRLSPQKFTGDTSLALVYVPSVTVLVPAGTQNPSAYSHSWPLAKLLLGQAIGPVVPSVLAPLQTPVFGLRGPWSRRGWPLTRPSVPPPQVSKTLLSTKKAAGRAGHHEAGLVGGHVSDPGGESPGRVAAGTRSSAAP